MKTLAIPANLEQLQNVQNSIAEELESCDCPMKAQLQIEVAVEEIFVHTATYACRTKVGEATIHCDVMDHPFR